MPTIAASRLALPLVILGLAAGCARERPKPAVNLYDGRQHFTQDHIKATVSCDSRPFEVDADRVSLTITGPCRHVIVAGDHNDIATNVLAGGMVEITGAHNDVTWRRVGPGPRPVLLNHGQSNSFRRGESDEGY